MHNRRIIIPIFMAVVVLAAGGWYLSQVNKPVENGALVGSGTVEAVEVLVSPELAGRVVEVLADEGDIVQAGDALFRLDDALLSAQRAQAETSLTAAQAGVEVANTSLVAAQVSLETARLQYDMELALARLQEQPGRATAWGQSTPEEFSLPVWYFTMDEELTAAQLEVEAAYAALSNEQASFEALLTSQGSTDILEAEAQLAQAQAAFLVAQDVLERAESQDDQALLDSAQEAFDAAQAELEAAQLTYDQTSTSQLATDVLEGRARLAVAQERYDTAIDNYNTLLTGENSLRVQVAAAAVSQAEANVALSQTRLSQAQTAIDQAQAQLDLLDVQMGKLVIYAPVSGVVLSRNIEPGEVVQSGALALTIGQLDRLTITVYIPEDRYGEISLGQLAQVTVDSFPDITFDASVRRIADQAEFTPRNVQTEEGRRTTVFAVELAVDDPQGMLKRGMPADVTFGE